MASLFSLLVLDKRLRAARYRAALLIYAAIVLMGSVPGVRAGMGEVASGFVLHSLAYGGIAFLLFTGSAGSKGRRALASVLTVAVMGAVDELIQSFLPYRRGALGDWLVDLNAALVVAGVLWALLPADRPAQ